MATDPIMVAIDAAPVLTSALKLADDGLGLMAQPIKSAQLDKPINEAKDRYAQYESILSETDPIRLDIDLGNFVSELCIDAAQPAGELSGRTRRVPVEYLQSFILIAIALIQSREQTSANAAK